MDERIVLTNSSTHHFAVWSRGFVRVEGLEPPCLAAPDPKSGMSTNFTTPAYNSIKQLFHSVLRRPDRKRRDMSTIPIAIGITTPAYNSIKQLFHSALRRPDRKRRNMSTIPIAI